MSNKFTEEKLEQAFVELLGQEGYPHTIGNQISRAEESVLIKDDFRDYLISRYQNFGITTFEVDSIILQLSTLSDSDIYESNKSFTRMLSDGFILKRKDRSQKDIYIQLIDYSGLSKQQHKKDDLINIAADPEIEYGKDKNIYRFVNQLEIVGSQKGTVTRSV